MRIIGAFLLMFSVATGWLYTWQGFAQEVENGSFETLSASGFPEGWEPVGERAETASDAYTGDRALKLVRTVAACERQWETGVNLSWKRGSGSRGRMLEALKGGVRFRYKVLAAPAGSRFVMNVIPMGETGHEDTGCPRVRSVVPSSYRGDDQWHEGWVGYDYSKCSACRWIQVSPRVEGPPGSAVLLDDIEWVEKIGAVPSVESVELYRKSPTEAQLRAIVTNIGDEELAGEASVEAPSGLHAVQPMAGRKVKTIGPGELALVSWDYRDSGTSGGRFRVKFCGYGREAENEIEIVPRVVEVFFLAERSVLCPGEVTRVELVAWNIGNAVEPRVDLAFEMPQSLALCDELPPCIEEVPPKGFGSVSFRVRALSQSSSAVIRCRWRTGEGRQGANGESNCRMVVGANPAADPKAARVVSGSTEIVFPKNVFGYGIGWVYAWPDRRLAGVVPDLGRLVLTGGPEEGRRLYAEEVEFVEGVEVLGGSSSRPNGRGLRFIVRHPDLAGPMMVTFAGLAERDKGIVTVDIEGPRIAEEGLITYEGPTVLAGEGSFGKQKSEALFPGLEWLMDEEMSSSNLDIEYDSPERLRLRPHPHKVTLPMMIVRKDDLAVSLLWHPRASWNECFAGKGLSLHGSEGDLPIPIFASPDRFHGHASHTLGLAVPTPSGCVVSNGAEAPKGWPARGQGARRFRLRFGIEARVGVTSVLDCMHGWFDLYGFVPPRALPTARETEGDNCASVDILRGNGPPPWLRCASQDGSWQEPPRSLWIRELELNMKAYLVTLWDARSGGWLNFKGGPVWARKSGPFASCQFDLLMGAALTDNESLRRDILDCLRKVQSSPQIPRPTMEDLGFFWGDPTSALRDEVRAAEAIAAAQPPQGGWTFSPNVEREGGQKIRDYAKLGYEGDSAIGLTASKALRLLRAYRLSGKSELLRAGLKCLEHMEKFRVPRGAQSWEVVVHSPDLIAAAEACEAFLEGYLVTRDERWRKQAAYWAAAGIPFLYHWEIDGYPWTRYASIPAFGSSWGEMAWFGRAVQWNGLRWALAVLDLASFDQSYPWRMMACGVIISAMYQQQRDPSYDNFRLWPDVYDTVTGEYVNWMFSPARIDCNIVKLLGYEPRPRALDLRVAGGEVRILSCAKLTGAEFASGRLQVNVDTAPRVASQILVAGVSRPTEVRVNHVPLPEVKEKNLDEITGWKVVGDETGVLVKPPVCEHFLLELYGVEVRRSFLEQNK